MTNSLDAIAANLPPVICRSDLTLLTFGILNSKTMANLDSLGKGIAGRMKIGKHVVYHKNEVLKFLGQRSSVSQTHGCALEQEVLRFTLRQGQALLRDLALAHYSQYDPIQWDKNMRHLKC